MEVGAVELLDSGMPVTLPGGNGIQLAMMPKEEMTSAASVRVHFQGDSILLEEFATTFTDFTKPIGRTRHHVGRVDFAIMGSGRYAFLGGHTSLVLLDCLESTVKYILTDIRDTDRDNGFDKLTLLEWHDDLVFISENMTALTSERGEVRWTIEYTWNEIFSRMEGNELIFWRNGSTDGAQEDGYFAVSLADGSVRQVEVSS